MIYTVREIEEGELAEVIPLIKKIFPYASLDIGEDDLFFVVTAKDRIVGFLHLVEKENCFVLQGLGVDEEHRRTGAGSALMEKVEQILEATDKRIVLKVKSMNPVVNMYERYGFMMKRFGTIHVLEKKRHN
jgi:ribosomal protein S18 acetylase RimI-like enzyme